MLMRLLLVLKICVNAPNLAHFEAVVKGAMELHYGGKSWLYFRTARLDMLINASAMKDTVNRNLIKFFSFFVSFLLC